MARVNIPVYQLNKFGDPVTTIGAGIAGDAANDHYIDTDGKTFLVITNNDGAPITAEVQSVLDAYNREGDEVIVTSGDPGGTGVPSVSVMGPLRADLFGQAGGSSVYVDLTSATGIFLFGIRLP